MIGALGTHRFQRARERPPKKRTVCSGSAYLLGFEIVAGRSTAISANKSNEMIKYVVVARAEIELTDETHDPKRT